MLLMWMKILRPTRDAAKAAIVPSGAGHAHMAHAPPGLGADARGDHLVVAPQRAVEEHQIAPRRSAVASACGIAAQAGM